MTVYHQMIQELKKFREKWPEATPVFLIGRMTHNKLKDEGYQRFKNPEIKTSTLGMFEGCKVIINEVHPMKLEVVGGTIEPEVIKKESPETVKGYKFYVDFHDGDGMHEVLGADEFWRDEPDPQKDTLDAFVYAMKNKLKKEN